MPELDLVYDLYLPLKDRKESLHPVILLHGVLDSKNTWKNIAPQIANNTGRKVYALDARNHGESPWRDEMTFDILAEDLAHFLIQHNIPKAVLIGHSMGGRTALTLALKKPQMVDKLIVEDMVLLTFRPTRRFEIIIQFLRESIHEIPPGFSEEEAKKFVIDFITSLLPKGKGSSLTNSASLDLSMIPLKLDEKGFSWRTNLDAVERFLTTERITQELNGVYLGDSLFLYGTRSFFKVAEDPQTSKFFPRSIKLGFEGATHLIHFEFPGKFIKEVSQFINGKIYPTAKY